jgi:hypothetical protein
MNSTVQAPPGSTPDDVQRAALQDAMAQAQVMHDAWWRVNDALRLWCAQSPDAPAGAKALAQVQALRGPIMLLKQSLRRMAQQAGEARDASALAAMTATPEGEALVRARLKQADLNLSALYQQLQALCVHSAAPLVREVADPAGQGLPPLCDAEVEVRLDYKLDESNALYDEMSNNILASQEAMGGRVGPEGLNMQVMDDDPAVDNWLDYKHRWMDRQGWLTHDVLEHNHGHHPRFGVAALLQTDTVWVEVHTVRSYAFDLRAGEFISPESK